MPHSNAFTCRLHHALTSCKSGMQYASFMGELQSSGLLKDGADASEDPAAAAAAPLVETEPVAKVEAVEAAPTAGGASSPQADTDAGVKLAANASPVPQPAGQGSDLTPDLMTVAASPASTLCANSAMGVAAAAEQRVLGVLEGAAEWSEVMDMASGQVYFWNSATNEVAWDPPQGSMPRYRPLDGCKSGSLSLLIALFLHLALQRLDVPDMARFNTGQSRPQMRYSRPTSLRSKLDTQRMQALSLLTPQRRQPGRLLQQLTLMPRRLHKGMPSWLIALRRRCKPPHPVSWMPCRG